LGPSGKDAAHRNWKQCAWKNVNDSRDIGLIKDCQITKIKDDTALRVVYQGNIYVGGCSSCCKRWFITFNGHCLLTLCCGLLIMAKTTTDPEQ